jgi:N-dimethylarginine dimethylaminohydrolase
MYRKHEVKTYRRDFMKETPSQLPVPSYVLNFPFTLSTENPNNVWMKELSEDDLAINKPKAYKQFMDLYNFIAGGSLTYLLPSFGNYQDQVYVANVGIYLPHLKDRNEIILSNFTSEPRQGEEKAAQPFFKLMGYNTTICPYKWEGEADLKYLGGNTYVGGYGIRSEKESYEWMNETFDMNIIPVEMVDEYLYHLDCSIFPLSNKKTMICTELFDPAELQQLEKYTEIVDVSVDDAFGGITNSVRLGNMILCASNIAELKKGEELYDLEKHKIDTLEKICSNEGMEPVLFNLSEYMKSGAMLSCCVMHLNYVDYTKSLI